MKSSRVLPGAVLIVCTILCCSITFAASNLAGFDALYVGDTTTAINLLRKPNTTDNIDSAETCSRYLALATALVSSGKFAEAEPVVQHLLKDPCQFNTQWIAYELENLGFLYELKGKYTEAESLYKRALELGKSNFGSCSFKYQLAEFYKLREKQDLAKQYLEEAETEAKAEHIFSGDSKAIAYKEGTNFFQKCFRRGLACEKAGEGSTAFLLYAAAVHDATVNPPKDANSAHLLSVIANSYESEKHYGSAIKTYEKALAILKPLHAPPAHVVREAKLGFATALDFSGNSTKAADVYFSIPGGPKSLTKTLKEWADGYRYVERARASGDLELERKAQLLYDRAAGLSKGSKLKVHVTMPPL